MVSHMWGDKDVDWKGIDDAAQYIHDYCVRYARLGGQYKEKYGTVRFYAQFGNLSLTSLLYPGYYYSPLPKWLWNLDLDYISPTLNYLFGKLFFKWQKYIYGKAYINAINKWKHLRAEILCGADWYEYIPGVTRVEGKETHILGWNGETLSIWSKL